MKARKNRLAAPKQTTVVPAKAGAPGAAPAKSRRIRPAAPRPKKATMKTVAPAVGPEKGERERLAISRPKKGASGKTGAWRTFRPVIDREKCNQCGLCSLYCPEGVMKDNLEIDYDFCKGCGICAEECPKKAIRMEREER